MAQEGVERRSKDPAPLFSVIPVKTGIQDLFIGSP